MKEMLAATFAAVLIASAAQGAPCDSPPAGSCLTYIGDCEGASSGDENYTVGALDRVDARGVDWSGAAQDPRLYNTSAEPEPEVTGGDAIYPSCWYGGRSESPGLNQITTAFDDGGASGADGWHDLDGFQIHAPNLVVEGMHIKNRGDGIVRQKVAGCGVDPYFVARGNWLEDIYDNVFESDGLSPALIEDNLVERAYKNVFAWRPQITCQATIDGSAGTVEIKNNLVELAPGASPLALGLADDSAAGAVDDGSGYIFNWPATAQGNIGPKQAIRGNVFLVYDLAAEEFGGQLFPLLNKLVTTGAKKCAGNVILFAGYSGGGDPDSWESYLDEHGSGPDGYLDGQRWGAPGSLYQTFTGASSPCYTVLGIEDDAIECIFPEGQPVQPVGSPKATACFKAKDFAELGGVSWDDRVAAWKSSHTAASE